MKILKLSTIYIWLLLLFVGCSSDDSPAEPTEEEIFTEKLQGIIDSKVGSDLLVGVSISIRVGSQERWNFVSGNSGDNEPMHKDLRFGIGSITKTVVGATILKLEEEGLISLEDPISKWLSLNSINVDESITIFQLLNHLTGLRGYFRHPDIWTRVEGNLDTPIEALDIVQYIGEPYFQPGDRYEYSNSNYLILGLIIEAVTGKKVGEVMRDKFWNRLQLNEIYFGRDENPTGPIAVPWRDSDGNGTLEDISLEYKSAYHSVFFTAADVFSTASDLSMWAQHLFNGGALSNSAKEKMITFLDLPDPIANGYGLGVRRVLLANRQTIGHTGGMRGYGSYMFYDPVSKVSIAMLNNQSRSENGPLLRYQLVEDLLKQVFFKVSSEAN